MTSRSSNRCLLGLLCGLALLATAGTTQGGPLVAAQVFWDVSRQTVRTVDEVALRRQLVEQFDFASFAPRALSQHWPQWSSWARIRFVQTFRARLGESLRKSFHNKRWQEFRVHGWRVVEHQGPEARIAVSVGKRNTQLEMELMMVQRPEGWKLFDLSVDGANLIRNYRASFAKVLREHGYPELLRRLQAGRTT